MNMIHASLKRTGRVLLIYTGGTIGMGRNRHTGALEPLDFNHILSHLPELEQIEVSVDVHVFDKPIDSSDMTPAFWAQMVRIIDTNYSAYDGFVVLHGTDTMAYTASALSFMLQNLTKPVILTGSQLPIGQIRTDGKENLLTSIELAAYRGEDGLSVIPEVCIYFGGHLLRGNRSTKRNAELFNAFQSFNFPHLCEVGTTFRFNHPYILKPDFSSPMKPHFIMNPNILVFSLFPGLQQELFQHITDSPNLRGIVMRTFGTGNAPNVDWLIRLLRDATDRGIVVVNISQCVAGQVEMQRYGSGLQLQEAGVISGYDSTIEAASTKLMHLTAHLQSREEIITHMNRSLAGEISI